MKNTHDKDMIWKNFTQDKGIELCTSKRFHQAMKRRIK